MPLESIRTTDQTNARLQQFLSGINSNSDPVEPHQRLHESQPYRHSYYLPEQFFERQSGSGIIKTIYGQRVLRVTELFFPALFGALQQAGGVSAEELQYACGFNWGQMEMKAFAPRAEQEFGIEFDKMNMNVMLETWWWPFRCKGWGDWRCDFRQAANGMILVELFDSIAAKSIAHAGQHVCHLYAGLFAAVFSHLAKRELAGIELQCASLGKAPCIFLMALPKRTKVAAGWRDQGAGLEVILQKTSAPM
jgi:predicted hydrocarbon binding protein